MRGQTIGVICLFLTLAKCDKVFCQSNELILVKIEWQDFGTETDVAVDCDQFRTVFKETIQTKSLNNIEPTLEITRLIKYFTKEKSYKNIDARGIITLNYKLKRTEYCFDKFGHFYKDGVILSNVPLMAFIKGLIYGKYAK